MKCVICGIKPDFVEEPIDPGWIPYFREAEIHHETACPECSDVLLQMDSFGEMELKGRYRGKISYKETSMDQTSEKGIFIRMATQRTMQSILN